VRILIANVLIRESVLMVNVLVNQALLDINANSKNAKILVVIKETVEKMVLVFVIKVGLEKTAQQEILLMEI
jgi:hypothetical protein